MKAVVAWVNGLFAAILRALVKFAPDIAIACYCVTMVLIITQYTRVGPVASFFRFGAWQIVMLLVISKSKSTEHLEEKERNAFQDRITALSARLAALEAEKSQVKEDLSACRESKT